MMAAIRENRSTHWEMLVIGSRAGAGGRPGSLGVTSSVVMSAISTNSKSRIRLTSFVGRAAVGLNGPGVEMAEGGVGGGSGSLPVDTLEAAAASSSSPGLPEMEGVKMGILGSTDVTIVEVPDVRPIWKSWWELEHESQYGGCTPACGGCTLTG